MCFSAASPRLRAPTAPIAPPAPDICADQQPSSRDIKQVMDKYGAPTIVGNQHLYYFYRAARSFVGAKYNNCALSIDTARSANALKLNASIGRAVASPCERSWLGQNCAMLTSQSAPIATARSASADSAAPPDRSARAVHPTDFKRISARCDHAMPALNKRAILRQAAPNMFLARRPRPIPRPGLAQLPLHHLAVGVARQRLRGQRHRLRHLVVRQPLGAPGAQARRR